MPKIPTNLSILLLLALSGGFAQETAPLKLTLKDAVNLALKQNPQVILANLGVSQSEQDRILARSALLPQVGARASETVNRLNLAASIGFSFPGFAQHVGPFYVVQAGVGVTAPVFDLTLWRRYRSSQIGVDSVRAQEVSVREESVLLVVSQYLGSQRAAADVQAAQSRVDLAQALYDQAADLQKNGVGTGIDTLRANVQLQNEKQRLIVARTQLETSLYGLARLLNIEPQPEDRTRRPGEFLRHPGGFDGPDPRSRLRLAPRVARGPHPRTTRRARPQNGRRGPASQALPQRPLVRAGAHARQRHSGLHIPGHHRRSAVYRGTDSGPARQGRSGHPPASPAGAGTPQPHRPRGQDGPRPTRNPRAPK